MSPVEVEAAPHALPSVEVVPASRDATAAVVIRQAIAASVQRLIRNDEVIREGRDPEGVHQARVATRRLRSDLRTFKPLLEDAWAESFRQELQELADLLGAVRDLDVMSQRMSESVSQLPLGDRQGAQPALDGLQETRQAARTKLLEELRSPAYVELLQDLATAATQPHLLDAASEPGSDALPPLAAKAWRRLKRAAALLPSEPPDDALHRIRILAKRARYALEAISPVTRPQVAGFAAEVANLQDVLGRQHDAVVAELWLREQAVSGRGDSLVLGQLIAAERGIAARQRAAWPKVWARVRRKHPSSWV